MERLRERRFVRGCASRRWKGTSMAIERTMHALNQLTQLFERAARFDGRPRERLLALLEAEETFYRRHPDHYRALQLIRIASQLSGDTGQRDSLVRCESRRITDL